MILQNLIKSNGQMLLSLAALEMEIYRSGVYGGQVTSDAIEELHNAEGYWGVHDPKQSTPRWICNG